MIEEQGTRGWFSRQKQAPALQIGLQGCQDPCVNRQGSGTAATPHALDRSFSDVDVPDVKGHDFRHAHPRRREQLEHRLVAEGFNGVPAGRSQEKAMEFLGGECAGREGTNARGADARGRIRTERAPAHQEREEGPCRRKLSCEGGRGIRLVLEPRHEIEDGSGVGIPVLDLLTVEVPAELAEIVAVGDKGIN